MPSNMTDTTIKAALLRAEQATRGPWHAANFGAMEDGHMVAATSTDSTQAPDVWSEGDYHDDEEQQERDAIFIAHARTDVPALGEALLELKKLVRACFRPAEWTQEDAERHSCDVDALQAAVKEED